MRVRSVRVGYSRTQCLEGGKQIQPYVEMTADLEGDDTIDFVLRDLEVRCEREVNRMIDDGLDDDGLPPVFYEGGRGD